MHYEGNCSTWSYDDDQFDSDISGNIKADDQDRQYGSLGLWAYTQHILVYDNRAPSLTLSTPDTFCTVDNRCNTEVAVRMEMASQCTQRP